MAHFSDAAIVLRRVDYSETSQVLTVLTRDHGKISLIGKGTRRGTKQRFATGLDLLDVGRVVYTARPDRHQNLLTMTEWQPQRAFVGLREGLSRLYAAEYAAEVTSALINEQDPHEGLYDSMLEFLTNCESSTAPVEDLCAYLLRLLVAVGLLPQADSCIDCRRPADDVLDEQVYFSSHQGGFICRDCEAHHVEKRRCDPGVPVALSSGDCSRARPSALFDVLDYHIAHLMGREPRLADFVLPAATRRQLHL